MSVMMQPDPYVTIPAAVRISGLDDPDLHALNRAGVLDAETVGDELCLRREDLDRVIRTLEALGLALHRSP